VTAVNEKLTRVLELTQSAFRFLTLSVGSLIENSLGKLLLDVESDEKRSLCVLSDALESATERMRRSAEGAGDRGAAGDALEQLRVEMRNALNEAKSGVLSSQYNLSCCLLCIKFSSINVVYDV